MKSTDAFKKTITEHLEIVARQDSLFAEKFNNPNKNIDDCITYILNTVQKSGFVGFTDDEVFGMAIHYYDEESIDIGKDINCHMVINHRPDPTPEEIEEAKKIALQQLVDEQKRKLTAKPLKTKVELTENPTLF